MKTKIRVFFVVSLFMMLFCVQNSMAQIIQPDSVLQKAKSLFQSVERLDINSKSGLVNLVIYDVLGKEIKRLVSEYKQAGSYKINFDASALASGVYFYSLRANDFVSTKKMLLLK